MVTHHKTYPIHPACSAWPALTEKDLRELAADIKEHGQLEAATITPDGLLLDGRNRMAACAINDMELTTVIHDGDPVAYSLSKNKHRRHLDKTALAFVGAELAKLSHGGDRKSDDFKSVTADLISGEQSAAANSRNHVAKELGIAPNAIDNAKAIMERGTAEVIELAKAKKVGLRAAADYVRHAPKESQVADPGVMKQKGGARPVKRDEARDVIRGMLEQGEPVVLDALTTTLGMSLHTVRAAEAYERGRLEGIAEARGIADAPLSSRQQQTLDRMAKELAARFDLTVAEEVGKRMRARDTDDNLAVKQAREVLSLNTGRLRPPLDPQEYATVLWALHPDNQSAVKTAEAFVIMRRKKDVLCDAGTIARKSPPLPDVPVRKTAQR